MLSFGNLKNILPKNLLSWQTEFFFLASSKAFSFSGGETSDKLLSSSDLPGWMELDTLYMFNFENDSDESEPRKKYSAKDIFAIHAVKDSAFKGHFHFIIELKEKVYFCGVESALRQQDGVDRSCKPREL